ncbi:MAG TPA: hypothetical protein VJC16_07895 [Candidatus Nanoarchaeia archaeon]|nr:hypothetical protein [Candidatus Nanoarchaeia archaeon]
MAVIVPLSLQGGRRAAKVASTEQPERSKGVAPPPLARITFTYGKGYTYGTDMHPPGSAGLD